MIVGDESGSVCIALYWRPQGLSEQVSQCKLVEVEDESMLTITSPDLSTVWI